MPPHATVENSLLQLGLAANVALSLVAGGVLLVAAPSVGNALGVDIDGWLRLFGIGLVAHALILAWVLRSPNPVPWTWRNLAVIAPYPLLMVIAAAVAIEPGAGRALVLLDGLLVGVVAVAQSLGIRRSGRRASFQPAAT